MLGTVTKELFLLGFLVLKEELNEMKYFSPFEKLKLKPYKHTEMDLGFVGFCFQRCPMWYSKCCLKRAEIKLNQRVLLRIDNCIPKYNSFTFIFCIIFFLDLKRNCISR